MKVQELAGLRGSVAGPILFMGLFCCGCGDNIRPGYGNEGGNSAPTISALVARVTPEDTPLVGIAFTVGDIETAPGVLEVKAQSSAPGVIAQDGLVLGGQGSVRTLAITPVADASGTSTITLTVDDGTAVTEAAFVVEVTPVNDPPAIFGPPDQVMDEDGTLGGVEFRVSDIDDLPDSLEVLVLSDNEALVPAASVVPGGGGGERTLAVTPRPDQSGVAGITLVVKDAGGLEAVARFVLTVLPVNDAPLAMDDVFMGERGTRGNMQVVVTGSVLDNDSDRDGPALAAVPFTAAGYSEGHGDVVMRPDGTFLYTPAPGFLGLDTFTYELTDQDPGNPLLAVGTVTIEVAPPMTWFVDNTAAGPGDGRSVSPFARLKDVETAPVTGLGDIILVARGDGTSRDQDQGIVLRPNQRLLGVPAPEPPVISSQSGDAVVLADGVTVANLIIDGPAGRAVDGRQVRGDIHIAAVTIRDAAGGGVLVHSSPNAAVTLEDVQIDTTGGAGLLIADAGELTVTRSAVRSVAGPAMDISDTDFSGVVFDEVSAVNPAGNGVRLSENTGALEIGSLQVTNAGGTGLFADSTGTLVISDPDSAVETVGGTAVAIAGSVLQVTLARVASQAGDRGISLQNTTGSFVITGDGSGAANGSGGVIEGSRGAGVFLDRAAGVSLRSLIIRDTSRSGMEGRDINGFHLGGVVLEANGHGNSGHGISFENLSGVGRIEQTSVTGAAGNALQVVNDSAVLQELLVTGSRFAGAGGTGNGGIELETRGSGTMNAVQITAGEFTGLRASAVRARAGGSSRMVLVASGNTFTDNNRALDIAAYAQGVMEFEFVDNPVITGSRSHAILVFGAGMAGSSAIVGRIARNRIGVMEVPGSGAQNGNGLHIEVNGQTRGVIAVEQNLITGVTYGHGLEARTGAGTGELSLSLIGNTVSSDPVTGKSGVFVSSSGGNPVCARIRDNQAGGGPYVPGPRGGAYIVGEGDRSPGVLRLEGYAMDLAATLASQGNSGMPVSQLGSNVAAPAAPCESLP